MELNLRKAVKEDEKQIGEILFEAYNIDSVKEGIEVFNNETKKGLNFLVAVKEEKIIGLISWMMKGLPKHGLFELDRIAVLKDFRGKGIARKLFEFMEKEAENFYTLNNSKARKLFLFTHEDNETAVSFYEKMGMEKDALLKNHYYKDKNELVLRKFLDD